MNHQAGVPSTQLTQTTEARGSAASTIAPYRNRQTSVHGTRCRTIPRAGAQWRAGPPRPILPKVACTHRAEISESPPQLMFRPHAFLHRLPEVQRVHRRRVQGADRSHPRPQSHPGTFRHGECRAGGGRQTSEVEGLAQQILALERKVSSEARHIRRFTGMAEALGELRDVAESVVVQESNCSRSLPRYAATPGGRTRSPYARQVDAHSVFQWQFRFTKSLTLSTLPLHVRTTFLAKPVAGNLARSPHRLARWRSALRQDHPRTELGG